jgi:hypothetical protein
MLKKYSLDHVLRLTIAIMVIFIGTAFILNLTSAPVMALPKPIQDQINEAHKKKEEQKKKDEEEKKKKEEEQKKKDEEDRKKKEEEDKKHKDEKDQSHRDNGDTRFLVPIIPRYDVEPEIKIINVSFSQNGRRTDNFEKGDYIDVIAEFRISSYSGFDNITVSCDVRDDRNNQLGHDSRSIPLRTNKNLTEELRGIVDTRGSDYSGKIYADVEIEIGGSRIGRTIQGRIEEHNQDRGRDHRDRGGRIRIIDSYLSSDDTYSFSFPGFPANSFAAGDPYWIVIEYEIDKPSGDDVEFSYQLTTGNGLNVDSGWFWDRERLGVQRIYRKQWMPYYIPGNYGWVTFHLKASHGGDYDSVSSSYNIYSKSIGISKDTLTNDFFYGGNPPVLSLGPVYYSKYPSESTYSSFFSIDDNIYMVVKYDFNPKGYVYSDYGLLQYSIFDLSGKKVAAGDSDFVPQSNGSKKMQILQANELMPGRYQVDTTLTVDKIATVNRSYFTIDNPSATNSPIDPILRDEPPVNNPIEYQIDKYFILSLPPSWNGKLSSSEKMPPLVFKPSESILGMVMFYDYSDPAITLDNAISEYEKTEKEATDIADRSESQKRLISGNNLRLKFYNGKIITKGQFLDEKSQDINIGIIYLLHTQGTSSRLYVVRLLGPTSEYDQIKKFMEDLSGKIKIAE